MEISNELKAGIDRFSSAIAPIVGETVSVTMRDGSARTGKLSHDTPCQPIVTTAEGTRYAVPTSEIAKLFAAHPTESGAEWLVALATSRVTEAVRAVFAARDTFGVRRCPEWETWAAAWLSGARSHEATVAAKEEASQVAVYAKPGAECRCWAMVSAAQAALALDGAVAYLREANDAPSREQWIAVSSSAATEAMDQARVAERGIAL